MAATDAVVVRTTVAPGDLGAVVRLHGLLYAREYGFDPTFEAYVAGPLAQFVLRAAPRERIWLAEQGGRLVGCVAIVAAEEEGVAAEHGGVAQLRWYLVDPAARGRGLGTLLLREAVDFARAQGYRRVILWTVSALVDAARLYRAAGFERVEERPGRHWGIDVVEEKYALVP